MERHTIIVTVDERLEKLGSQMQGERITCSFKEYQKWSEKMQHDSSELVYVLPIPVGKIDKNIDFVEKLKVELIKQRKQILCVFGGVFSDEWKAFLEEWAIPYVDLYKVSEVVEGNAWITAEATLAEVYSHSAYSVCGQKILVTGYGACGSKIAALFSKVGAEVVVAARREEIRKQALLDGYKAIDFFDLKEEIGGFMTVINTVPAMVITEELIQRMRTDSLIIDIASKPGGCDFAAAKKNNIQAKLALGLPGIYTTSSSAAVLKNAILNYVPLQDKVSEEQLWIFQIVI